MRSSTANTANSQRSVRAVPDIITPCNGRCAKRFSAGVQFDFNYTYSKSIDLASLPENNATTPGFVSARGSTSIINSWFTNDMKAVSDYDVQHNFSALWVVELPFGKGNRCSEREPRRQRRHRGLVGERRVPQFKRPADRRQRRRNLATNWQVGS